MIDFVGVVKGIQQLEIRDFIVLGIGLIWGILFGRVNRKITEMVHRAAVKVKGWL